MTINNNCANFRENPSWDAGGPLLACHGITYGSDAATRRFEWFYQPSAAAKP